ncbi:MAG: hypothetical protein GX537_03080 [Actinobacteria bacterium]|nr:hypothetical protein [Actinomycetota bacterium]
MDRDGLEKVLMRLRRQRDEAETLAAGALERLARLASGLTPLSDLNADEIEGAADDLAAAVRKYQLLDQVGGEVRQLLI